MTEAEQEAKQQYLDEKRRTEELLEQEKRNKELMKQAKAQYERRLKEQAQMEIEAATPQFIHKKYTFFSHLEAIVEQKYFTFQNFNNNEKVENLHNYPPLHTHTHTVKISFSSV